MVPESSNLQQQYEVSCGICRQLIAQFYLLLNIFVERRAYRRKGTVAELAGLSPGALTHYIQSARCPSALVVIRLADALKLQHYERVLFTQAYIASRDAVTRLEMLQAHMAILSEYQTDSLLEEHKRQHIETDVSEIHTMFRAQQPLLQEIENLRSQTKK